VKVVEKYIGFAAAFGLLTGVGAWLARRKPSAKPRHWSKDVEPYAPADPATTCDPSPKPGVELFRAWVLASRGGYDAGISRACDTGARSEHHEGRAWDWGILAYKEHAAVGTPAVEAFLAALLANDAELARRAGIQYMIFNRRIWTAFRHAEGWRSYTGPSPHTDHVHFSFSRAGARGETSLYPELRADPAAIVA
jgi:hypothetical protein